jgi:hypothetical protein
MICARHHAKRAYRNAVAEQQLFETARRSGVTWGLIAVLTEDELIEDMAERAEWMRRRVRKEQEIPVSQGVQGVQVIQGVQVKELEDGEIEEEIEEPRPYANIEFSIEDDERPPPIWRPSEHGYCLFCDYKVHSNPPEHFTDTQRKHCCGWCATSLGRGHGEHCQRCP